MVRSIRSSMVDGAGRGSSPTPPLSAVKKHVRWPV